MKEYYYTLVRFIEHWEDGLYSDLDWYKRVNLCMMGAMIRARLATKLDWSKKEWI